MSGDLFIERLHNPELAGYLYHQPRRGAFHCHYIDSPLSFFGLSWYEVDDQLTILEGEIHHYRRRGKRRGQPVYTWVKSYLPIVQVRALYNYLSQRQPESAPDWDQWKENFVIWDASTGQVIGHEPTSPPLDPYSQRYQSLIAWRDELCLFLSLALSLEERILAQL